MLGFDVDIGVSALETHQEPHLPLSAILALPDPSDHLVGQVVEMFLAAAREDIDQVGAHARFFKQLAQRGGFRIFALVNATLRHLPGIGALGTVQTLPDKYFSLHIGKHDAGTGPIRKFFRCQGHVVFVTSASMAFNAAMLPSMSA